MKVALTIAGSDPTGGAGLQTDLKVFRAFNVHGLSVTSVITAQNTNGVNFIFPIEQDIFEKQIHTILSDIRPDAIKIGMIYSPWAVEIVEEIVKKYSLSNLVVDPVTVSSSGKSLVSDGTLDTLKERLFPLSRVITPNIYEASVLTGTRIEDKKDMIESAKNLKNMGPEVVVITGGHLKDIALDLYFDGDFHYIKSKKMEGEYHGTGCAFSSAITASIANGKDPLESVRCAKKFINKAIKNAYYLGNGMGLLYV
ncbi:MAG: bifunctional hydroxymethylpyrimidine kinase/phosphomethylpyrimidine kinase [Thermodesulfovibrionales bacterium]